MENTNPRPYPQTRVYGIYEFKPGDSGRPTWVHVSHIHAGVAAGCPYSRLSSLS